MAAWTRRGINREWKLPNLNGEPEIVKFQADGGNLAAKKTENWVEKEREKKKKKRWAVQEEATLRGEKGGVRMSHTVRNSLYLILRVSGSTSFYPIKTQCRIITACCLLHNLIRREM